MDIDSMDKVMMMGSKDHHHHHQSMIMKGKRTKRPRQPSPASAVFTASSCSSGGEGGGGGDKMHTKIRSSESLCSEILSTSTEEDEDMANCLILLAQSGHVNNTMSTTTMSTTTIHINNNNIEKQQGVEVKLEKITSSRKFKEMATSSSSTIGGKVGIFVYECKTCNRSFPSFQALGGHRTSHKKHKPTADMEEKKKKKFPPLDDHHHEGKKHYDHEEKGNKFVKIIPSTLLSLEIAKKNTHSSVVINSNNNNIKVKIHECSICGAEFSSGQALGGHMRRHRIPTTSTAETSHDDGGERPRNILELDLNLPAPLEDDQFQFSLFSSSLALVDCQF